ncbi:MULTISPECIES: aa3-type cytochrome oxidase subunit I [Actinomycetes]|jgi:cytochrome c oxidase subunit 1|uniref:Cytochrome c oxidase subunit 1 n=2 Tax=Rhodococcus qingshengii TaxID=334542 RepID=A0AB38RMY7_RHOSG|nr:MULTISPECIES: cytochrome c oxidase subunit I [Rhodococcus]MCW0192943.1 cytochrome c oxidase subunit I [Rhodococcus sp. (in: high G+C Gram-positive bacteria)]NHP17166.1 cytochrome c oxidase subunit I [Rhodococcus sp. IC4_135]ANQ75544.1 cytochrome ubiquinol oxidase subunit I [Rhodococcus sp. 008]KLN70175.1 cytochrome C oxidase subunit 1 [Rhodococcus erythropolis]KSU69061.1 cytochrome ubiquinol oxidase subunit I [Rhodococcus qingshengii]
MTAIASPPIPARPYPARRAPKGSVLRNLVTTTDHKTLGLMYLVTSFAFFLIGGLMALIMRSELAIPGMQFLSNEQYNQLFTMHGTIMLLLYATPVVFGFANFVLPLQIGAPDVAFPRLNAFSYWLYLFGALIATGGFVTPGGAADFGWTAYTPLSSAVSSPGVGADLWIVGLLVSGLGTILGAVNMITTIVCLRAPGMTMFRMPIFTWNIFITSVLILLAFPLLTAALFALLYDRRLGGNIFDPANGGVLLWQHLFWFFGHPEVYIIALPFFGIVSEIFPVFSRKPIFGYSGLVYATLGIAALSIAVWAHHMYATGAVLLPYFSFMTFLIAVPTGVKIFNWIGTMWKGHLTFESPMLFSLGFLITFLFGGLSGVLLASPPLDFQVTDTYFVVAHFHYVVFGTVVFATYAGIYFWFPKMTGRMMDERLGKWHFWTTFVGFHMTFLVQHWLGAEGMPRRYADYLPADGFTTLNTVSTIGSFILGASTLPFIWNVFKSYRFGEVVTVDDPWGYGNSLEWATTCPPPRHNFTELPRIRSERPAFELHYPHMVARMRAEAHVGAGHRPETSSSESEKVLTASTSDDDEKN